MMRTRPEITDERVEQIKRIITDNPSWNRTMISKHICRLWGWQSPTGQLKDISCRDILRELDRKGLITLPAPLTVSRASGSSDKVKHLEHDMTPVHLKLSLLRPLHISVVNAGKELVLFKSLIDQYHYLKYDRTIGENMKYLIYSNDGKPLSCMLFSSAAWSCKGRDELIGWDKSDRMKNLSLITNNSRYLIAPWIEVKHLASHILSVIARRISDDWQHKYGHPVYCLETFVEIERFRGTCYRAANWIYAGRTTGRGRDGGHHNSILPLKDIYIYPLVSEFKKHFVEANSK